MGLRFMGGFMKKYLGSLCALLTLVLVACGGSASQIMSPMTSPTSIAGVYEGTTTTAQENGIETSLLIEEDNSFSLVTDSGLQLLGNLTQVNSQQYNGTAVLSYAEDFSMPTLSVSLSFTVNANGSVVASFNGGAVGSFSVLPSADASATSSTLALSSLAGNFSGTARSMSTRQATNWTFTSTGTMSGSDAVSTYSGTLTQPRANKNPFAISFTRRGSGAAALTTSFTGRVWFHPAKGTRPARLMMASRNTTTGARGIAGVLAKQ